MSPGRIIVFEGLNGVGKTTLARAVAVELDLPYVSTPPQAAAAARSAFDEAPFSEAALLFYLSWVKQLGEDVRTGRTAPVLICDRYISSTRAYFTAGGLLSVEAWIKAVDIFPPSLTILVTTDERIRQARLSGRDRRRKIDIATDAEEFRRTVLSIYRDCHPLLEVDATTRSIAETVGRSAEQIRSFLEG